jgi:hypothetical protein
MTVATSRCPACFARLRSGDPWCGQCLTELRRVAVRPDDAVGTADGALGAADGEADGAGAAGPALPAGLADDWTARLAAGERDAGRDTWSARLVAGSGDRSGRLALAVGGAIALLAGLLVVMAVLGSLQL